MRSRSDDPSKPGANDQPKVRIPPLPREEWTDAAREVFAVYGAPGAWENGSKVNNNMVLANHPPLGLAVYNFGRHFLFHSTLPPWTRELITLRMAWHLRSQYEWHRHVGYALKAGMTLEQIADIGVGPDAGSWNECDQACLRCVDELWDTSRVTDETWATLSKFFVKQQMMDLIYTMGQYVMIGWGLAAFGVQLEDNIDPIGFDLKTASGKPPTAQFKPGEVPNWSERNKQASDK